MCLKINTLQICISKLPEIELQTCHKGWKMLFFQALHSDLCKRVIFQKKEVFEWDNIFIVPRSTRIPTFLFGQYLIAFV